MKVYISGKIGDLPMDEVIKKFRDKELELLQYGFDVVNPVTLPHNHDKTWFSYMIEDLQALRDCTHICLLPCHTDSPGALIEKAFAKRMGLKIIDG
jgi:hypothetical protein